MSNYPASFAVHSDSVANAFVTQNTNDEQKKIAKSKELAADPSNQSVITTNTASDQTIQATYASLVDNL